MHLDATIVAREAAAGPESARDVATMTTAEITGPMKIMIQETRYEPTIRLLPRRIATIGIVGVRTSIRIAEPDSTGGSDLFCNSPEENSLL